MESLHMPFWAENIDGKSIHFFCKLIAERWKMFYQKQGQAPVRLETGLPDMWNECCPSASWKDGAHISFVAGIPEGRYHLYTMDMGSEPQRLMAADVGYARWGWKVHGMRRGPVVIEHASKTMLLNIKDLTYLYRVTFDACQPIIALITCARNGHDESLSVNLQTGETKRISLENGVCLYKACHAGNGQYVYANRLSDDDFELRELAICANPKIEPLAGVVEITEDNTIYSQDCLPCLRKHLAQSISYMKEISNGHGIGASLDHRPDLEGEIGNAESHAKAIGVPGYYKTLRDLRHKLDNNKWIPETVDVALLRRLWKSTMGMSSCNCGRNKK